MHAIFDAGRLVHYFLCFFYVGTASSWTHGRELKILAVLTVAQLFEEPPGNSTDQQDSAAVYNAAFFA